MTIIPIKDENSNFEKVILITDYPNTIETPHCKQHGAMNKVSSFNGGGYWRCCVTENATCRAGCIQVK